MLTLALINRFFGASTRAIQKMAIAAFSVAKRLNRALAHRSQLRDLAQFDDHMLHDIGLSRSEVNGALEAGLFTDPAQGLAARDTARQGLVRQHQRAVDRSGSADVKLEKAAACC
jgi:uncharacterized protein YjiS (DUF1127 family)